MSDDFTRKIAARHGDRHSADTVQYNLRVPRNLLAAFTAACRDDQNTPAAVMRDFMRLYIEEVQVERGSAPKVHHE